MIDNSTGRASLVKRKTIWPANSMFSTAIFADLCFFTIRVVHRTLILTPVVLLLFTLFDTLSSFIPLLAPFVVRCFTMLYLISQRIYIFAFFQGFSRSLDNLFALQASRDCCRSRHGSLSRSSQGCLSWILQIILSVTSESLRSAKLQVVAKSLKSVTSFSIDSHGFCKREKTLHVSTVSFFFRLQIFSNASMSVRVRVLRMPSYCKFFVPDSLLNTKTASPSFTSLCHNC